MSHHSEEHAVRDPVCGMELGRKSAVEEGTYQDKSYYFRAQTCRKAFEVAPKSMFAIIASTG